jgi:hypothetical protein
MHTYIHISVSVILWFSLVEHQFGFRPKHPTIEQIHRLIRGINDALDNRQYCSAAFLDISQAFEKVWHTGLLYKLRQSLPLNYFLNLNFYLSNRHFVVKVNTELTAFTPVNAGVPQGSVLCPFLYLLYTADFLTSPDFMTATFADDTEVVATDCDPATASQKLQASRLAIQSWLKTWRMQANDTKSVHVTFTTRRAMCPPVHIVTFFVSLCAWGWMVLVRLNQDNHTPD